MGAFAERDTIKRRSRSTRCRSAPNIMGGHECFNPKFGGVIGKNVQKVPIEKQVAAPPMMTMSPSFVNATLEPIIRGRGISEVPSEVGIDSRLTTWILEPRVEKTAMSSSRLITPWQPTPPAIINKSWCWICAAPTLDKRVTVSSPTTVVSEKVMVGVFNY